MPSLLQLLISRSCWLTEEKPLIAPSESGRGGRHALNLLPLYHDLFASPDLELYSQVLVSRALTSARYKREIRNVGTGRSVSKFCCIASGMCLGLRLEDGALHQLVLREFGA